MRERVRKSLLKKEGRGLTLSTFHSLGLNILKKHIDRLGFHMPFMLQTPGDLETILIDSLKQRKIDPKLFPPKLILSHISRLKNMGEDYKRSLENSDKEIDAIVLDIFDEYVKIGDMILFISFLFFIFSIFFGKTEKQSNYKVTIPFALVVCVAILYTISFDLLV